MSCDKNVDRFYFSVDVLGVQHRCVRVFVRYGVVNLKCHLISLKKPWANDYGRFLQNVQDRGLKASKILAMYKKNPISYNVIM